MIARAERLAFVAQQLRSIRETLVLLTGSPRCAEVRMVRDLEAALLELGHQATRPRSSPSTVRRWSSGSLDSIAPGILLKRDDGDRS